MKYKYQQDIIGFWTNEQGTQKLEISGSFLVYSNGPLDLEETYKYKAKFYHFPGEDPEFYLYPKKNNEDGLLGAFDQIELRGNKLVGSLLIQDLSVNFTEFRKDWVSPQVLGNWVSEDGEERLEITKDFLIYSYGPDFKEETYTYIFETWHSEYEKDRFILLPTWDNKNGIIGAFEKIEYTGFSLIGSILVHDMAVVETEFRRDW
jgi:hypothetical protein